MSGDEELRQLERRWLETGDEGDALALVVARCRSGHVKASEILTVIEPPRLIVAEGCRLSDHQVKQLTEAVAAARDAPYRVLVIEAPSNLKFFNMPPNVEVRPCPPVEGDDVTLTTWPTFVTTWPTFVTETEEATDGEG